MHNNIMAADAVEAYDNSLAVTKHTTLETPTNMSPENKAHFLAEKSTFNFFNNFSRNGQEQYDWLADTDEEVDEQELEAHYSYMAKIPEVPIADSGTDSEPVEQ
nr:hypothetical protein [Tanacetum cinerariifolium]